MKKIFGMSYQHHRHFAPEISFLLFLEPNRCSPHAGSASYCRLVAIFHDLVHPTFANLWQSCHIPALLSISFSVFLFFSHQLLSVVPSLGLFLHPNSPHAPIIATFALSETFPISLHLSSHESSHCLFYLSMFFHISFAIFSFLYSSASFHLPLSILNIQHHE